MSGSNRGSGPFYDSRQSRGGRGTPGGGGGPNRPKLFCTWCHKTGHTEDTCGKKHGRLGKSTQTGLRPPTGTHPPRQLPRPQPSDTAEDDFSYRERVREAPRRPTEVLQRIQAHAANLVRRQNAECNIHEETSDQFEAKVNQTSIREGLRTSFGLAGNPIDIATNYLDRKLPSRIHVYTINMMREHGVGLQPIKVTKKADKMLVMQRIARDVQTLRQMPKTWAHDGDLIWSTCQLWPNANIGDVVHQYNTDTFSYPNESGVMLNLQEVWITYSHDIDLGREVGEIFYDATSAKFDDSIPAILSRGLNAFLTANVRSNALITTGGGNRSFQSTAGGPLSNAIRALKGFFLSTRPGNDSLLVNINTTASPFFQNCTVAAFIGFMRPVNDRASNDRINGVLKGVKVSILNNQVQDGRNNTRFIAMIDFGPNNQQHPPPPRVNVSRDPQQPEWHDPSNLQIVEWQPYRGTLTTTEVSAMIRIALRSPQRNANMIVQSSTLQDGLYHFAFDGTSAGSTQGGLTDFGQMSAGTSLLGIKGRHLNPPTLQYQGGGAIIANATWNLEGRAFTTPKPVTALLHLVFANNLFPQTQRLLERNMAIALQTHGLLQDGVPDWNVRLSPYHNPTPQRTRMPAYETFVRQELATLANVNVTDFSKFPSATTLVVIEKKDFDLYAAVKRAADLNLGLNTVCVTARENLGRRPFNAQKASNIALKYNLKGAGVNHHLRNEEILRLRETDDDGEIDTIVLGADVAHPGPGSISGCPSIAAVVGTTDDQFVHFPGSMRLQVSRQEGIVDFSGMVYERLLDWAQARKDKGKLPRRVLFYRDGVSESQYEYVRDTEIPQLQKAFNDARDYQHRESKGRVPEREGDVPFKVTVVVAGKRHNTRFYPLDPAGSFKVGQRLNGNVIPGLVVDQTITHPYQMDFFLQSHLPIQGTGRSAHYYVITNGMELTADDLQNTTHAFCYIYARATRGVSYCAPAYYADRLCDRGRAYLRHWLQSHDDPSYEFRQKLHNETYDQFCVNTRDHIIRNVQYRPYVNANPKLSTYGRERMNPWHPNLDNVMFYL